MKFKTKGFRSLLCMLLMMAYAVSSWAASALPLLTEDTSDPILYRIQNTRRAAKGTASYWSPTSLSTNQGDATQVYFTGTKTGTTLCVKIHLKDSDQTLAADFTWGNGIDWYIKAFTSAQGGGYKGVLISNASTFPNVNNDKPADDGLGCWYVGSSNAAAWLYGGQWDGSIFTMDIVDPSRLPEEEPETGLIVNHSFETGDITGWVYSAIGGDHGVKDNSNSTYTCTNAHGDYVFNTWVNSDNYVAASQNQCVYQTINGLTPGEYTLTAQVASNTYANVKTPVTLFANNYTTNIVPQHKGSFDDVELTKIFVTPDVRSLTVGVRSASWFKADNFVLTPKGETAAYKAYVEKNYSDASIAKPVMIDCFDGQKPEAFTYKEIGGHTHGGYPILTGGEQKDYTMTDRSKMQNWTGNEYQLGKSDTYVKYAGLPNGYYRISSEVRVYDMNGDYNGTATGLSLYANAEQTPITTGEAITHGSSSGKGFYGDYNVICKVEDGNLETGLRIDGSNFSWLGWQNFRVEYIGTENPGANLIELNLTAGEYAPLCLPYDLKPEYFGQTYLVAQIQNKVATLIPVDEVPAGTPCVVMATGENNVTANDVTFNFNDPRPIVSMWDNTLIEGNYDKHTWTATSVKNAKIAMNTLTYEVADLANMNFTATQENNAAARFWAQNTTYLCTSTSVIEKYLGEQSYNRPDQPQPIVVPIVKNAAAQTLQYSRKEDFSAAKTVSVAAGTNIVELYNLMPGLTYYYKTSDGKSAGQFTVGGTLRMIYVGPNVYNMRDLGGKKTSDNKYVKYGKIFRSGEMNGGYKATAAELQTMRDMGVAAEIDLRNEETGTGISPFGFTVEEGNYYVVAGKNYIADGPSCIDKEDAHQHWKNEFEMIVRNLRDLRGVDFHCRIGADRTGMLAILLEGLLGVKEADLLRDYETTSFSSAAGTRVMTNTGFAQMIRDKFKANIPSGGTLRTAFENFFVKELGCSKDDVLEFRSLMLDSDPTADAELIESLSSLSSLKAAINQSQRYQLGDGLGQYTTSDEAALSTLNTAIENANSYIAGKDYDLTRTSELVKAVNEASATLQPTLTLNMPKAGDVMYLKSNSYGSYISCNGIADGGNVLFDMVATPDETCLFTFDGMHFVNYLTNLTFANGRVSGDLMPAVEISTAGNHKVSASSEKTIGCYNIKTDGSVLLTKAAGKRLEAYDTWLSHTDADIQMIAATLPDEEASEIELRKAVNNLNTALSTADKYTVGSGLSQYSSSIGNDACKKMIEDAKAYHAAGTYNLGAVKTHLNNVNSAVASLTLNMPKAGQKMYMQSVPNKGYVSCDGTQFPMIAEKNAACLFTFDGTRFINDATGKAFASRPVQYGQGVDARILAVDPAEGGVITVKTSCMGTIGAYSLHTKDGGDAVMILMKETGKNVDGFYTWFAHDDEDIYLIEEAEIPEPQPTVKYYTIASKANTAYVADLTSHESVENATISVYEKNATMQTQHWQLVEQGDYYQLLNRVDGLALNDPSADASTKNTHLNVVPSDPSSDRQLWSLVAQEDGYYNLISKFSNHTFNLEGGNAGNGVRVISWDSNPDGKNKTSVGRLWLIEEVKEEVEPDPEPQDYEFYQIISAKAGARAVDVETQNPSAGRGLMLFTSQPKNVSQHWQIKQVGDYYMFLSRLGGWAINDPTVGEATATTNTGTQINIEVADETKQSQLWKFVEIPDAPGWGNLINVATDHTLNINGGTDADGTILISYKSEPTSGNLTSLNRRWKFVGVPNDIKPDTIRTDSVKARLTDVPHIYIYTANGASIKDKKNWVKAEMYYIDEQDNVTEYKDLQIRARGNSTFDSGNAYKMPYRVKFAEPVQLLGKDRANARNWALMANAYDKTMMRNALTAELSDFVGLPFSHGAKFVDVSLNGYYVGTYQITDHPEAAPGRLELPEGSGVDVSYFLECDGYAEHTVIRTATKDVPVRIHKPGSSLTSAQKTYVKNFMDDFEARLFGKDFKDPVKGYRAVVDSVTLAAWYIADEVSANVDGFWSQYFYKEAGNPQLHFGPLWDYDIAYANDNRKGDTSKQLMKDVAYELNHNGAWIQRMWEDPWFQRLITRRYQELVDGGLQEYMLNKIDSLAQVLDQTQAKNYEKYGYSTNVLRQRLFHDNYADYVKDLKSFINTRVPYLSGAFADLVTGEEPVTGIEHTPVDAATEQKVYDLSGRRVVNPKHGLYISSGKKRLVK